METSKEVGCGDDGDDDGKQRQQLCCLRAAQSWQCLGARVGDQNKRVP